VSRCRYRRNGGVGVGFLTECFRFFCSYRFVYVYLSLLLSHSLPKTVNISPPTEWRLRSALSTEFFLSSSLVLALSLPDAVSVSLPNEWWLSHRPSSTISLVLALSLPVAASVSLPTEWLLLLEAPTGHIGHHCSLSFSGFRLPFLFGFITAPSPFQ
jgi:hypothetical protein